MPRLLVFQHVAHEILGTLDPLLRDRGFRIRYVNFDRHPDAEPSTEGYDGLVVLGGPMSADDTERYPHLAVEAAAIRKAVDQGIPVLGICLGAQLLALALDASVRRNPRREIGWYPVTPTDAGNADPLLSHFGGSQPVFHWHGDTFSVPEGALHLASSEHCTNQAFRFGDRVWGLQFHLEVDEPMIDRWLEIPVMRDELEQDADNADAASIRESTTALIAPMQELGDRVFSEFLSCFGTRKRFATLPSR